MSAVQQHMFGPTPDASQSQWFTPDWLARRVVDWAALAPNSRVVELGAGDGAFVRPLEEDGHGVWAVERDPRFVVTLMQREHPFVTVVQADVLEWSPGLEFDAYAGNPPYEDDADIAFVERGLLLAHRSVVVLRLVFLAGKERYRRIWSKHHLARIAYLPERPRFVGEKSGSALADFAVFDIRRGPAPVGHRVECEWWLR